MIQTEYGISRPWYWPFIAPFERFRTRREKIKYATAEKDVESARTPGEMVADASKITTNITSQSTAFGYSDVTSSSEQAISGSEDRPALVISRAHKRFGNKLAVKEVSISVGSGKILALLGPNGAGKTTLINCVLGLYRLSSGTAQINGFDIEKQQDRVYRYVGVCPQHEILWPDLTCEEHLLFYVRLKGIDPKDEDKVVGKCLEEVELLPEQMKLAKELSGGQRRRLAIAIALVARPAVVFLDEPTTGM